MVIAIDGPAGSGKSTTARAVAQALDFLYLDTGAMYRAVALEFLRRGAPVTESAARELLAGLQIDLKEEDHRTATYLNGEDVSEEIRRPAVSALVSDVAALPVVREKLVAEQRRLARRYEEEGGGVVLDGRDIGTVVFPDAELKIFMIADETVRAQRRFAELTDAGIETTFEDVLQDIRRRDERDATRSAAPLVRAGDAIDVDTSNLDVDEQVRLVVRAAVERRNISTV